MPPLDEGSLLVMPTTFPGIAIVLTVLSLNVLVLLFLGGMAYPLAKLPTPVQTFAKALPADDWRSRADEFTGEKLKRLLCRS